MEGGEFRFWRIGGMDYVPKLLLSSSSSADGDDVVFP